MAAPPRKPTESELAILRVLWQKGSASVRDVQQSIDAERETGYTTVLKLMQIMFEKGLVTRDESVRPQIYRPRYTQQQTQKQLVGDLVDRAFGGSVRDLVLQALSSKKSSPEELAEIEQLLNRMEEKKS
jgi:predicted transcriptional regulator